MKQVCHTLPTSLTEVRVQAETRIKMKMQTSFLSTEGHVEQSVWRCRSVVTSSFRQVTYMVPTCCSLKSDRSCGSFLESHRTHGGHELEHINHPVTGLKIQYQQAYRWFQRQYPCPPLLEGDNNTCKLYIYLSDVWQGEMILTEKHAVGSDDPHAHLHSASTHMRRSLKSS